MVTLFINTPTKLTQVAVFRDHELLSLDSFEGRFHEFDMLIPHIEGLLTSQDMKIDDIDRGVVCKGPGGFTSVRLGVSTANTLYYALDIPFASVDVFQLYREGNTEKDLCVFLQANKEEVYVQGFGKWAEVFPEARLMKLSEVSSLLDDSCVCAGEVSDEMLSQFSCGEFMGGYDLALPWGELDFRKEIMEPWYYKEANISVSKK